LARTSSKPSGSYWRAEPPKGGRPRVPDRAVLEGTLFTAWPPTTSRVPTLCAHASRSPAPEAASRTPPPAGCSTKTFSSPPTPGSCTRPRRPGPPQPWTRAGRRGAPLRPWCLRRRVRLGFPRRELYSALTDAQQLTRGGTAFSPKGELHPPPYPLS
jgi:hypothetical protein